MPDLESIQAATAKDQAAEIESFQKEFSGARFQRAEKPEEDAKADSQPTKEEDAKEPQKAEPDAKEPTQEKPEGEPTPDAPPAQQVKLYTVPDQEMYGALRGKRVTAAQLEEAGLIDKVIVRDHQEMHNTKLYQDLKRDFDEKLNAALGELKKPAATPAPQISPKDFGDNVERTYVPVLKKLAESGSFEPDFVEAYPRYASQVAHQIESMRLVGAGVVKALDEIRTWVGMQQQTTTRDQGMSALHSAMDGLSKEELYSSLADNSVRTSFVEWMVDKENPQTWWKKLDIHTELSKPEILKSAFLAFKSAKPDKVPTAAPPRSDTRERARLASAGGGNARPAKKDPTPDEFENLKNEIQESRARAFGR